MDGFDGATIEELRTFIFAAGHVALAVLGCILGWQK